MPHNPHPNGCACDRCPGAQPHPADSRFTGRCLPAAIALSLPLWLAIIATARALLSHHLAH